MILLTEHQSLEDEALHEAQHTRFENGAEWGKRDEKEMLKGNGAVIATAVELKDGQKGRIICVRDNVGGKVGSKVQSFHCLFLERCLIKHDEPTS